jgi:AcrR family transcriptional regulator
VNDRRIALLDACERKAGDGPLPLEEVLNAFLRPVMELYASNTREFAPLMGRLYTEPAEFVEKIYKNKMEPVATRFIHAYQRALPGLPKNELVWRLHFSIGALAHTLAASHVLRIMSDGQCDPSDVEGTLKRLKAFMIAGLRAPVTEVEHAMQ